MILPRHLVPRRGVRGAGLFAVAILFSACVRASCPPPVATPHGTPASRAKVAPDPVQAERDELYGLAAMAVAHRDWQQGTGPTTRGYNIGSVLVDPEGRIVAWGRNANRRTGNGTQHAEVRMMQSYLASSRAYYLEGYTVYTTLEPCAQCSGMMVLSKVRRVVYALADPDYGAALERLALDSRSLGTGRGHAPYPRAVVSEQAISPQATTMQRAATEALARPEPPALVAWLASPDAERLFSQATVRLAAFETTHPENSAVATDVRAFVESVPTRWTPRFPWDPPAAE